MRRMLLAPLLAWAALAAPPDTVMDKKNAEPPVAAVKPQKFEKHGVARVDNYFWLRERENPQVISYLDAENQYLKTGLAHTEDLQRKLFSEFKTRIKQDDSSVPYRRDGYYYYSRMEAGKNYIILCRKKGSIDAPEEILVDGNAAAAGLKYFQIGPASVSTDNDLLAWSADTVGRRFFTFRFKKLSTGEALPDVIKDVTPSTAWANDNKTFFYARQDPQTLRSYQIYRHVLGTDPAQDKLMYEEKDPTFNVSVFKTKSKGYILINSSQTLTEEYRYLDANKPDGEFQVLQPRERGHEYTADHYGGHFYILSNKNAKNFRLMRTEVGKPDLSNWEEVIPHKPGTLLQSIAIFRDQLVVAERSNALVNLRVKPWSGQGDHLIEFNEPAYAVGLAENFDFDSDLVRFRYSSLTTPTSVYDYNVKTKTRTLLKRDPVLGGFDPAKYVTERLSVPSHDGIKVPVSIVYRKDLKKPGGNPLLQYGYGSYGASTDANFNPFVISLLDRGFVYAIAHIRGGQENGREWYEDGKLMKKKNTFRDFIAVTEHLVKGKYADPKRVYARGGSAGGLLVGAVMNMRPDLYHGVLAAVPFVDVINTMLDDTIPLTTFEYDEWGNPNEQQYFEYMLSYSPYDQVEKKNYPNLLVTTGLHDSQVQYWEPAKWVAKLRATKAGNNKIFMQTNMEAGHGGASARDKRYEELALEYAFILDLAGLGST
ncbi:MAG TPA: S9 family peptidase [Bryobacteraceae bacterium]|nr:S9 family peptidase [Bryobacteraceae bacterium]